MTTIYTTFPSPIGELVLTASDTALTGVHFRATDRAEWVRGENAILADATKQLTEYFARSRTAFDLPLDASGTAFEQQVWELLRGIPYGSTTSYGALARRLGDPTASRAVGAANGKNPIPIVVPCHRVIGSNGQLTGFGGGLDRKRWLLEHEGALLRLGVLCLSLLLTPFVLDAQAPPRRSQHGSVSQRVGTTEIAISYSRPVARGRTLFGADGIVHWGSIWHPGADSATTISFSKDVTIEGQALAIGRYTLWAIPAEPPAAWTMIFSRAVDVWHTPYPGDSQDALRVTVRPETGAHMETLAYYFPIVAPDSTVLRLHWGTIVVPVTIKTK